MKKTLLILCYFVFSFAFGQINSQVTPLTVCDTNNDGYALFNLTIKIPEILGNLNPNTNIVSFHLTATDAEVGFNAVFSSSYFSVSAFSQIIYVRVDDTTTGLYSVTSFELLVTSPANAGTDGQITVCETDASVLDLHSLISGEQPGGIWVRTAGVGGTFSAVSGTYTPSIGATTSIFEYLVTGTSPCANDTSIATITVINQNNCTAGNCQMPGNLLVSNTTSSSANLSWTNQSNATSWEILVLPFGSSAPTANASSGIITNSNPFTITGLIPNTCYSAYVRTICTVGPDFISDWSQPASFCMYNCENNGQCPESLSLVAFLDSNNNGTKESNENVFNNGTFLYTINNSTNQYFGYTDSGSYSIFDNDPTNVYNFSFLLNPTISGYYGSNTAFTNVAIVPNSGNTTYYFPITVLQTYTDLEIQLIPNNNPNPGFVYANTLVYKNNGTQTINSGTVTFTNDNQVTINYVSQSGTTTLPNGFSYNFTNLAPFEQRSIYIQMQVPTIPTISLGTLLTNSASITSADSDAVPSNNLSTVTQAVVGSYDPNDKTESHGEKIVVSNFSSSDYLTYTIRFENMGTANTQFIRVEDFLHSSLNTNSVEVLNARHPFKFTRENNKLVWNFYNITLTPTSVNNELSHGFVQFRVKPNAGYSVGTIIPNSAEIYFDYNPPIFTNTYNTEFVQSLSSSDFESSSFTLFPNPANDFVTIKTSNATENIKAIAIYDFVGKIIKSISDINSAETTIDCSTFSKGIYLIEISNSQNLKTVQKLVLH